MPFWQDATEIPEGFISVEKAVFLMTDRIRAHDPNFQVRGLYIDRYPSALRSYILEKRLRCVRIRRRFFISEQEIKSLVFSGKKGERTKIVKRES